MRVGAVVLAGGRSSRMGRPKALLDWHGRPAVAHAVEVVRDGVGGGPVCVVRAPGQELPPLDAIVVDDPVAYGGPLAGSARGPRRARRAGRGRLRLRRRHAAARARLRSRRVRVAARRRRRRRAGDRRSRSAAARRLPRAELAAALGALLDRGALGLRDIPGTCAVRELVGAGAARRCRARRGRSAVCARPRTRTRRRSGLCCSTPALGRGGRAFRPGA